MGKPPIGFLKLNFDAAVLKEEGKCGLGGVMGEDYGIFMAGFTNYSMGFSSIEVAKGVTILSGIKFETDSKFRKIIVE